MIGMTKQSGFTLMESLVALIVLSIGMLGIAALYLESMKAGRTALARSQAVTLAADMADRIRANATAGAAYAGPGGFGAPPCVAGGVDCTPAQMAAEDVQLWLNNITASLPNGAGAIIFNNALNPPQYTITVSWVEPGEGNVNYVLQVQI
ncbi:MAG: type IV pilus modification protein PilV [Gammaproteobacteria bacterium]|nr:type IV pilus modification protein PilV [Gammaproteobacteria bacterium]